MTKVIIYASRLMKAREVQQACKEFYLQEAKNLQAQLKTVKGA